MAALDPELIAILDAGTAPTFQQLEALSLLQLEVLTRLALLQIALDPKAPSAARVAALKGSQEREPDPKKAGSQDPGSLHLDAINAELACLK